MPTDLTQDVKELFKSAPPPRRVLFSQWQGHEYAEEPAPVPEPEPMPEQIVQKEPVVTATFVPVTNQSMRRKYDNESRNLRRMAVLRCLETGMTNRKKIARVLKLPEGTVFHDIMYWRKQPK
jgi:hypothetical protein